MHTAIIREIVLEYIRYAVGCERNIVLWTRRKGRKSNSLLSI